MKVHRGNVILIDFPFSNYSESKIRPALVIQADFWNQRLDSTILAGITSSRHRRIGAPTQYFIDISSVEGEQTGLRLDSVVQCEKLITLSQRRILRVIGSLSDSALQQIDVCLKSALGIH